MDWSGAATPPTKEPPDHFKAAFFKALGRIFTWLYCAVLFFGGNLWDRLRGKSSQQRRADRLYRILRGVGPTGIKLAQQASMRIDIIPYAYAHELEKLLDKAAPFPPKYAVEAIERATNKPLAATFLAFDPTPVGSASLACVYQAILRNGDRVAVKVRRPGVGHDIAVDLRALRWVLKILETLFLLPWGFSKNLMEELESMLMEELNFSKEARYTELFGRAVKKAKLHFVRVPRVYFELSNRTVLVQEFVSGIWLTEIVGAVEKQDLEALAALRQRNIHPKTVAHRLLYVARFGGFESLLFHADLHPANVLVQDDDQLVLIDFGSCGSFTKGELVVWRRLFDAQGDGDIGRMTKAAIALLEPLPPIDLDELNRKMEAVFFQDYYATKSKHSPWWERTSANIWISFLRLARKYQIPMQLNTLRMIRVTMLADTLAARLDNSVNIYREYQKYAKNADRRAKHRFKKRLRKTLTYQPFTRLEQLFETASSAVYRVQRILDARPILNFALIAGKAAMVIDILIKSVSFTIGVESFMIFILWSLRRLTPALALRIYGGLVTAAPPPMPTQFWRIGLGLLSSSWNQDFIVVIVIWTLLRIHTRVDDPDVPRRRNR